MKNKALAIALILLLTLTACSSGPKEVTDMAYTVEVCGKSFSGSYTGTVLDENPNGAGTFTYESSKESLTYSGQWENGVIVGTGELEYDGFKLEYRNTEYTGTYNGQTENGLPCGEGEFEGEKRDKYLVYEGNWTDGTFSGEGYLEANEFEVIVDDNDHRSGIFIGEVLNGIPTGTGKYSTKNLRDVPYTYEGEWKSGQFNGIGTRIYNHEDYYIQKGTFANGKFTPTPKEFFTAIGSLADSRYSITSNAQTFISSYPEIFTTNCYDSFDVTIDKSFKFNDFSKSPDKYGDSLITVSLRVIQTWEEEFWSVPHTYILGRDGSNNYYYMYMYNSAQNIHEGSWVKATMLPLDHFTYETVSGTKQWAMAAAAVTITK